MKLKNKIFRFGNFLILLGFLLGVSSIAQAYKAPVHGELTEKSYDASILVTGYLRSLGIIDNRIGNKKVIEWFIDGSQFEDGEPVGSINSRPLNHFYDPVTDSGLTVLGFPLGTDAINWGLETKTQGTEDQEYSIKDARSYLFTGLTGLDDNGNLVAPTTEDREAFLGKAFRSIGQVVHLIQDMAQPQHVRNDPHLKVSDNPFNPFNVDHSLFEEYPKNLDDIGIYPVVQFTDYTSFWTGNSKGLADFTNANFVSEDTNFEALEQFATDGVHPEPQLNLGDFSIVRLQDIPSAPKDVDGNPLQGNLLFFGNYINDYYSQELLHNDKMTTRSIFDNSLKKVNGKPVFSLNRFNFDEQAKRLLPRAVGYSAGLINYFFRGKLAVSGGEFTDTSRKIVKFKVANLTPNEAATGTVTVAVRYRVPGDDTIYHKVSEAVNLNSLPTSLENAGFEDYVLSAPVPEDAEDLEFMLAFKGTLGSEVDTAVIGHAFVPTYALVTQDKLTLTSSAVTHLVDYDDEGWTKAVVFCGPAQFCKTTGSVEVSCVGDDDVCAYKFYPGEGAVECELGYTECRYVSGTPYHYAGSGLWREWDLTGQNMSGRIETPGKVRSIQIDIENLCELEIWDCVLSNVSRLWVNGELIEDGVWEPGDTVGPPQTWLIEGLPGYLYSDGYSYPYDGDLILRVTMGDEGVFRLGLAYYRIMEQAGLKSLTFTGITCPFGGCYPGWISSSSRARLEVQAGFYETPDRILEWTDMYELIQLSGYGPTSGTPGLFVGYTNSGNVRYSQGSSFFCIIIKECESDFESQYDNLPTPPPAPLSISGQFHRTFSDEEKSILEGYKIRTDEYDLNLN